MSPISVLFVVLGYFLMIFVISFFTGRNADNNSFFVGNRKSPWFVVAFGMIGASLSGVTFISVPGWVGDTQFAYMQMVFGYFLGYVVIANVLLPLYYRLNLTSIYTYLEGRFGSSSYKTGAWFFLISRTIGAAFRLFLVANVLQLIIFDELHVPFYLTVVLTILLIWLYTFRGGIKTIVWTDTLQTIFMLLSLGLSIFYISKSLNYNLVGLIDGIRISSLSKIWFFDDFANKNHFVKQFFSGAFITIVMTGLDQDMMQKNLSCRSLKDAKKNMYLYGLAFVPVNFLFMVLGILLFQFVQANGMELPQRSDDLFPMVIQSGLLPSFVMVFFILGLVAAAYSSADSALTSLTTSFSIDVLNVEKLQDDASKTRVRKQVHVGFSVVLMLIIIVFKLINKESVISALFTVAGYTYGPLLGMYSFGLFTRLKVKDALVPIVAILAPLSCIGLNFVTQYVYGESKFGFEMLIINGALTFIGLYLIRIKKGR